MRYVSTRVKNEAFTAREVLNENRGPEGGFFVPDDLPRLTQEQLRKMGEKSFSENAADAVNLLFGTTLDGWSLEFAIGRYPARVHNAGNRTYLAEVWHNPAWRFDRMARSIEKAIRQSDDIRPEPSDALVTGARIAALFGIFGELLRQGLVSSDLPMDVVVPTGDFSAPMACRYARQMGLPIHNILSCCNENGGAWSLIHKGELRTDVTAVRTDTPLCDISVPQGLEKLIFETLGMEENLRFLETLRTGGNYYLEPHQLQRLREGMYAAVVSKRQMESAVTSLYGSYGILADPYTALCVGGIGAYRSKTGESRPALVISEESPRHHLPLLAKCLGTTAAELKQTID